MVSAFILLTRWHWVTTYGSSVAFFDQWETEGTRLLVPWQDGQLAAADLLRSHNEHRIALQRLWTLVAFHANEGQWDNAVEMAGMVAAWAIFLGWVLWTWARRVASPILLPVALVLVAANVLPYAWENLSIALQAAFLQIIALTVLALHLAAQRELTTGRILLLGATCGMALLTVGSGLLTALAALSTLLLRTWIGDRPWQRTALATAVVGSIAALGFGLLAEVPGHAPLRAQDPAAFLHAFSVALSWPFDRSWALVAVLWAPWLVLVACLLFGRQRIPERWRWPDAVMAGLGVWVLLQGAAVAYSRGHGMDALASRYAELMAMGLVVNVYAAWRLVVIQQLPMPLRGLAGLVAVAFTVQSVQGLRRQADLAMPFVEQRAALYRIQLDNVRRFTESGDTSALRGQPWLYIPFPDGERLIAMLSMPALRAILPAPVQPTQPLCDLLDAPAGAGRPRSHVLVRPAPQDCPALRDAMVAAGLAVSRSLPSCAAANAGVTTLVVRRADVGAGAIAHCRQDPVLASARAASLGRVSAWLHTWAAPTRVPYL